VDVHTLITYPISNRRNDTSQSGPPTLKIASISAIARWIPGSSVLPCRRATR